MDEFGYDASSFVIGSCTETTLLETTTTTTPEENCLERHRVECESLSVEAAFATVSQSWSFFSTLSTKHVFETESHTVNYCTVSKKSLRELLRAFLQCHSLVDASLYVSECQRRSCSGSSYSSYASSSVSIATFDICTAMELYADACFAAGVCVPFRDAAHCRRKTQCTGKSKVFINRFPVFLI